jgi:hypothetical protein
MWNKIWKNKVEFYPHFSLYLGWFFGSFVSGLRVENRPGIMMLGFITIPSILIITMAFIKTYKGLPSDAS